MIEVLQEFDFQVDNRPCEKHGNADAHSRRTIREPEWQEDEEEATTGSCPESTNMETAIAKLREPEVLSIMEHSEENVALVGIKASSDEIRAKQSEDSVITTILQKTLVPQNKRLYNCSTFGVKSMTREQAQKLGLQVLGLRYNPGKDWQRTYRCTTSCKSPCTRTTTGLQSNRRALCIT